MSGTQVFGIGCVFKFHAVTGVSGYQCVIVKDFHIAWGIAEGQLPAYVCVRDTVEMGVLAQAYVTVLAYCGRDLFLHLITERIQRSQCIPLDVFKIGTTGIVPACQGAVIMQLQSRTDRGIETLQVGTMQWLELGVDVLVGQFDGILHKGLVFGFTYTGRKDRYSVVFGKTLELLVQNGFMTARFADGRLQIIGNYRLRNSAVIIKGILTCGDKILFALTIGRFNVRQQAATEYRNKDLHLAGRFIIRINP